MTKYEKMIEQEVFSKTPDYEIPKISYTPLYLCAMVYIVLALMMAISK
jgi:hypothetical protein